MGGCECGWVGGCECVRVEVVVSGWLSVAMSVESWADLLDAFSNTRVQWTSRSQPDSNRDNHALKIPPPPSLHRQHYHSV